MAPRPGRYDSWTTAPVVLIGSLVFHVAVLGVVALIPAPSSAVAAEQVWFEIDEPEVAVPPEPEETIEPPPEPEPVPAAVVPRRVRVERAAPEPPPPSLIMTAEGPADPDPTAFAMPPGVAGGVANGSPGGSGTGLEGPAVAEPLAPAPTGLSRRELRQRLLDYIRSTLSSFVSGRIDYPLAARRAHAEGVVVLRLRLADDGRILSVRLSSTSGHDILDRSALARVRGFETMPAPPGDIPWDEGLELPLPVTYRLQ